MSTTPATLPQIHLQNLASDVYHWTRDPGIFDLDAPYQRGSVWTDERRSNLIRSLLMGLPVGSIIVSKLPFNPQHPNVCYRVVDGKQRVLTVQAFMEGNVTVPGHWFRPECLEIPAQRSGTITGLDLSYIGRRFIESRPMSSIEFDPHIERTWTADNPRGIVRRRSADEIIEAEAELFLLVNFGGVDQTEADEERAREVATG